MFLVVVQMVFGRQWLESSLSILQNIFAMLNVNQYGERTEIMHKLFIYPVVIIACTIGFGILGGGLGVLFGMFGSAFFLAALDTPIV